MIYVHGNETPTFFLFYQWRNTIFNTRTLNNWINMGITFRVYNYIIQHS